MPGHQETILKIIDALLPQTHSSKEVQLLYTMMRDYPFRGGKMIRSRLLMDSYFAHAGSNATNETSAWKLAAGLELFQNWVLVHDDIEDESEERRGKPALHKLYGLPLALNAGDALHVYMWQLVLAAGVEGAAEEFLTMIHRTAEGQHMDLAWIHNQRFDVLALDYLNMIQLKTARYTVVSPLRLGALAAGVVPDSRLLVAGLDLGVAFQIRDDVLNLVGDKESYGKEIAGDLFEGKRTLMLSMLLNEPGISEAEKNDVVASLRKPRDQKTSAEIENILALMRRQAVIEHAQAVADEKLKTGMELLTEALQHLPNKTATEHILALAKELAARTS